MSISQLRALQSLSVMFLLSEVPKYEIWIWSCGGRAPPILLQPRVPVFFSTPTEIRGTALGGLIFLFLGVRISPWVYVL